MTQSSKISTKYNHSLVVLGFYNNQIYVLSAKPVEHQDHLQLTWPLVVCESHEDLSQVIQHQIFSDQSCEVTHCKSLSSWDIVRWSTNSNQCITWVCVRMKQFHLEIEYENNSFQWQAIHFVLNQQSITSEVVQIVVDELRILSQSTTILLQMLPSTFRFRHARFLYNQLWDTHINPHTFKSWMRKTCALKRVGPSRYSVQKSMRKAWQVKS